ncbi:MAG: translation elongation factor Ts [Planctomycetes bacterium RBG_16_64_10]|nr:MAG: translation elongation factor Ts [Planctomycetes bacterium RBG_16_64_10]
MAQISAAAVKDLRDKTQLPMMECKRALEETHGDQAAAIRYLREQGKKTMATRLGRTTEAGRIALFSRIDPGVGGMIELQCESAPVANHEQFRQLADDLVTQLATGPGAQTADALWSQPSPSHPGITLAQQRDEIANRIREVFHLPRLVRIDAPCGGYMHHTAADAVLLEVASGTADAAKQISMHIAAMRPQVIGREDIDPEEVQKERAILTKLAQAEGKPAQIIDKMVEGRLRNFFAERVLMEQPFVKDETMTVGKFAQLNGVTPVRFIHWQLGTAG